MRGCCVGVGCSFLLLFFLPLAGWLAGWAVECVGNRQKGGKGDACWFCDRFDTGNGIVHKGRKDGKSNAGNVRCNRRRKKRPKGERGVKEEKKKRKVGGGEGRTEEEFA